MQIEEALEIVTRIVPGALNPPLRSEILRGIWQNEPYAHLAERTGRGHDYVRRVGAEFLRSISDALGQEVGKGNLRAILEASFPDQGRLPDPRHPFPGGPLPVDSPIYVPPADLQAAEAEIEKPGCLVRIAAPHHRGKSSLALRLARHAAAINGTSAVLDFRLSEPAHIEEPDALFRWLAAGLARAVGHPATPADVWTATFGPAIDCLQFLEKEVLPRTPGPLVVVLDDLEPVLARPAAAAFFLPFLRSAFEEARHRPAFGRLRWVLCYPTESLVPLDVHSSPFNVGLPIRLPMLTPDDVRNLARHYGLDWDRPEGGSMVHRLAEQVGGHPYLVQMALYHLSGGAGLRPAPGPRGLLANEAGFNEIFAPHLRALSDVVRSNSAVLAGLGEVLNGRPAASIDPASRWQLESLGLVVRRGDRLQPACPLYDRYFRQDLTL